DFFVGLEVADAVADLDVEDVGLFAAGLLGVGLLVAGVGGFGLLAPGRFAAGVVRVIGARAQAQGGDGAERRHGRTNRGPHDMCSPSKMFNTVGEADRSPIAAPDATRRTGVDGAG